METKLIEIPGQTTLVVIKMDAVDLAPHYEEAYVAAQPHIEMKGYRKGKAPISVIKRIYGKRIEDDALETIARKAIFDYLESSDMEVFGNPKFADLKKESDGSVEFTFRVSTVLPFDLKGYRDMQLKKLDSEVSAEELEKAKADICYANGHRNTLETIEDADCIVDLTIRPLDKESGIPLIGSKSDSMSVDLHKEGADSEVYEKLKGLKLGDSYKTKVYRMEPGAPPSDPMEVIATVQTITGITPCEFDDELAEKLTKGQITSANDLEDVLRGELTQAKEKEAQRALDEEILFTLFAENSFITPQDYVFDLVYERMEAFKQQQGGKLPKDFNAEQFAERVFPEMYTEAGKRILVRKIADREGIEVSDEDYRYEANLLLTAHGLPTDNQSVENLVERLMDTPSATSRILADLVFDFIKDNAEIEELPAEQYETYHKAKMEEVSRMFDERNKGLQEGEDDGLSDEDDNSDLASETLIQTDLSEGEKPSGNIITL